MLDIKFVRENPDVVKQNIRNKFQEAKLPLVDEVIDLDQQNRSAKAEADNLRAARNKLSKQIGQLMGQGKKEEAEAVKAEVTANAARLAELEVLESELKEKILKIMTITFLILSVIFIIWFMLEFKEMLNDHRCYNLPINEFYQDKKCERYWDLSRWNNK